MLFLLWNQLSSSQIKKPSFVSSIRKGNKTIQALLQAIGPDLRRTREIVSGYVHLYISPCHAIFIAGWHLSGSLAPLPVFLNAGPKTLIWLTSTSPFVFWMLGQRQACMTECRGSFSDPELDQNKHPEKFAQVVVGNCKQDARAQEIC